MCVQMCVFWGGRQRERDRERERRGRCKQGGQTVNVNAECLATQSKSDSINCTACCSLCTHAKSACPLTASPSPSSPPTLFALLSAAIMHTSPRQVSVSRRKEVSGLSAMIRHFHMRDVGDEDTVIDCRSFLL